MTPEAIKVGETYNVRMKFEYLDEDGDFCFRVLGGDDIFRCLKPTQVERAVYPLSDMANGTKNAENAPKYDPNRKFRKGDKVKLVEYKGRHFNADAKRMCFCTGIVTFSETENEYIDVCVSFGNSEEDIEIDPAYLELVTPVEELEPYSVVESDENYFWIHSAKENPLDHRLSFNYHYKGEFNKNDAIFTREEALAAAEAECARLNAEYRKERENG